MARRKRKPARRAKGEGSPVKLPSGKWKGVFTLSWKPRKTTTKTFETHADCLAWLNYMKAQRDQGEVPWASSMKLCHWVENWLKGVKLSAATSTYEAYRHHAEGFIVPALGRFPLKEISAQKIRVMFNDLEPEYENRSTLEEIYKVLSVCLSAAVEEGYIRKNPIDQVSRPKTNKKEIEPFTIEEVKMILKLAQPDRLYALFVVAFSLGMRQGEMYALRWSDIDFDMGSLRVERQAVSNSGKIEVKPPKTDAGRRTILLAEPVIKALIERRKLAAVEGLASCPLVFPAPKGGYVNRSSFAHRTWKPLLRKAKVGERGLHHARHTFATHALCGAPGVKPCPLHIVSQILGHSSPAVTLKIYAHLLESAQSETMNSVARLFAG